MANYNYIYDNLRNVLDEARNDLARCPLVIIKNRATRKVTVSVFTPAVSDCVDRLGQCVATALRDGDTIDAGELTYRCVDIQQLVDWLDVHDGNGDTPADLYGDLPDIEVWDQAMQLSVPMSDFIEYLEELANL